MGGQLRHCVEKAEENKANLKQKCDREERAGEWVSPTQPLEFTYVQK